MKNKWGLVIHQACQTTVSIWVGTLFSDLRKYDKCEVKILDANKNLINSKIILSSEWLRPFKKLSSRFYKLIHFNNLAPGTTYLVEFNRLRQKVGSEELNDSFLANGQFETLPELLSKNEYFVIALWNVKVV